MRPIDLVMQEAAEQHGAVSVAQMRELGLTARAQRAWVAKGQLRLVEPGVAVVVGAPDTWFQHLQVGLLALGPQAWVSHEAAAALLELNKCLFEPVAFTKPRGVRTTTNIGSHGWLVPAPLGRVGSLLAPLARVLLLKVVLRSGDATGLAASSKIWLS